MIYIIHILYKDMSSRIRSSMSLGINEDSMIIMMMMMMKMMIIMMMIMM
jgi:hypothetical protein